jgi:peptide-methionine (S)-S-oxide reductase
MNEIAVFGGGCFWCTEAIFQSLKGVKLVLPGYTGGQVKNPTYEMVCGGNTGHAEATKIEFDPLDISYQVLLEVFFATHDPTTLNRQGHDVGTQYRSVIFYSSLEQKQAAEEYIKSVQKDFSSQIVTQLEPLSEFYVAENYHQNYFNNNKNAPYCQAVINPKLKKFREKFIHLINN